MGLIDRRQFMGSVAAVGLAGASRPERATASDAFSPYDAIGQAQLVRSKQATVLELVDAAITRIEVANPKLNAVVWEMFDNARARAKGALPDSRLSGVPYLIKDLNNVASERTTSGSRFPDSFATANDPMPQKAIDAGLIIVGKTNTPEFGLLPTTESLRFGPCHNPWNLDRSAGGSSGCAAAAVAAGLVPAAHASDGGGSIRIPASCCGVFGLKPSRGRMNLLRPMAGDLSVQNCISRTVRDNAMVFSLSEDTDAHAPFKPIGFVSGPSTARLRIAFGTAHYYDGTEPHPDVKAAVEASAKLCESLGHTIVSALNPIHGQAFIEAFVDAFMVVFSSAPAKLVQMAKRKDLRPEDVFEPWTLELAEYGMRAPPDAISKALAVFKEAEAKVDAFMANYDAWLTPMLALPPIGLGEQAPTLDFATLYSRLKQYIPYTPIHNVAGTPAMSVPLGMSGDGLPTGSQFAAAKGREDLLYALAYELEAAQAWVRRTPKVWVG